MTLIALDQLIDRYRATLDAERSAEAAMIADVATHGGSMPNNAWQARWRAESRLRAALAVREAFEGEA